MATAMEPLLDSEDDLLMADVRSKSPYGEPLGKFHVTTEWPQPLPRSRHARRPRTEARYRTQPVTFDEIREVDEDTGLQQERSSTQEDAPRTLVAGGFPEEAEAISGELERDEHESIQRRLRIDELKCPIKLEALNSAIDKIMKRPARKYNDNGDYGGDRDGVKISDHDKSV